MRARRKTGESVSGSPSGMASNNSSGEPMETFSTTESSSAVQPVVDYENQLPYDFDGQIANHDERR